MLRYKEVMESMEKNYRNSSRHRVEEHNYLNWLKANRKVMNKGEIKDERQERFKKLLALSEEYRHINQYK